MSVLRGWGSSRCGLVACFPAVPSESVQGISFCLVSLFHMLQVLTACVGIREALCHGACGVRRRGAGVQIVAVAVL
eukprot:1380610-Pleurochrysis_carterae.AAC.1